MKNKILHRRGAISALVLLFWAFFLSFVFYQNDWFGIWTSSVSVQEKEKSHKKEIKKGKRITEKKKVKDSITKQPKVASKIYLPTQTVIKKPEKKRIEENVNKQPDRKPERPIERKEHLAFKEQPLPVNAEKKEEAAPEKLVSPAEITPENVVNKNLERSISKQISLPEKKETTKRKFDFSKYKNNLIKNYKVREGEKIPLLLIDDHNQRGLYKQGLSFYGYQLIAKPEVKSGKPYYFVINNSGMERIDEAWPYGNCPPALREDRNLFRKLLSQPQFAEISNMEYELFYAPLDTRMIAILESKLKLIIESIRLDVGDISQMTGTFKKIENSYILIIESIVTIDGRYMKVNDPDNRIAAVG